MCNKACTTTHCTDYSSESSSFTSHCALLVPFAIMTSTVVSAMYWETRTPTTKTAPFSTEQSFCVINYVIDRNCDPSGPRGFPRMLLSIVSQNVALNRVSQNVAALNRVSQNVVLLLNRDVMNLRQNAWLEVKGINRV